ncbi:SANT/Myb_domain [Hexamita inflata]|uniref:SANT/Myb domain n=1 Tax=Hexamita inflata TaxID=28002 RepID=A0AA86U0J6_9EUKA|nr:SANT/Myb domain [Hexamita inflata]
MNYNINRKSAYATIELDVMKQIENAFDEEDQCVTLDNSSCQMSMIAPKQKVTVSNGKWTQTEFTLLYQAIFQFGWDEVAQISNHIQTRNLQAVKRVLNKLYEDINCKRIFVTHNYHAQADRQKAFRELLAQQQLPVYLVESLLDLVE